MLDGMGNCNGCGRSATTAATESSHSTSEGLVRYRRCVCGRRWVELAAHVITARGMTVGPPEH